MGYAPKGKRRKRGIDFVRLCLDRREGIKMDQCLKIWFYTPAQLAGQLFAIIAGFIGIVAALAFL